jgi:hypothetical protein
MDMFDTCLRLRPGFGNANEAQAQELFDPVPLQEDI